MSRMMRRHVSHIPSQNRQCSSLSSKKVALFCTMWHPNRWSPGGSIGKSVSNAGDMDSISGLGISLVEGNGNPLQDACLGNLLWIEEPGREALWGRKSLIDDPADGLSELATPGETRWAYPTSTTKKSLAFTEHAFHDPIIANKQVQH